MNEDAATPSANRWNLNLKPVVCPECGERMPTLRIPTNEHQLLWGGWTCSRCGCEMDKHGQAMRPKGEART